VRSNSDVEVEVRLKNDPMPCPCDDPRCDKIGQPTARIGHIRGCRCRRCIGRANRRDGLKRQNVARKRLGIPGHKFGDSNEEKWSDNCFANEVKSGKQVGPLANWWRKAEAQILANRADHGDKRLPARCIAMPEGWSDDGLVVVRLSVWDELVRPALDECYGPEAL
jgi:hypothetical protein